MITLIFCSFASLLLGFWSGHYVYGELWSNDANSPVSWGDFGLIAVGLLQVGVFIYQFIFLRQNIKIADDAAKASKEAADIANTAFVKLERPWLVATNISKLQINLEGNGSAVPFIQFELTNHGKTPAILKKTGISFSEGTLPTSPYEVKKEHALGCGSVVGPGETVIIREYYPGEIIEPCNTNIIIPNVRDDNLFFVLYIAYDGLFTSHHETKCSWRYYRLSADFVTYAGDEFNYIR